MQMKNIIVATDFSKESLNALNYIAMAIQNRPYEIVLFTLQNPSIHAINARVSADSIDSFLSRKQQRLEELARETASKYVVKISTHFASGEFYREIINCIKASDAHMLVMGMPNKSVEQDMMGNTTTAAISRLKIPILSIPEDATFEGIKHILFACDVVRGVQKTILERIKDFAADFGATVEVFNVRKKIEEISETSTTSIDEGLQGITYYYRNVTSNQVINEIKDEIKNSNTDLLVMVPYKYGFWNALVHRSKTRVMASGNSIPLLAISI